MLPKSLFSVVFVSAVILAACASPTPTVVAPTMTNVPTLAPTAISAATGNPTSAATTAPSATPAVATSAAGTATAPTTAVPATSAADSLPYPHTACSAGVNLAGQTINLYHMIDMSDGSDNFVEPAQAGYADAAAYLNAHGGICGATIGNVFPATDQVYDGRGILKQWEALSPKPALIAMYYFGDEEFLRNQLADDQIPALAIRIGSTAPLYGQTRQTPSWIYATEPLWSDQIGAVCDYLIAHPERYPHPVIGFLPWDNVPAIVSQQDVPATYCQKRGVGFAGIETATSADHFTLQQPVDRLIQRGATVIFTTANQGVPAGIAQDLVQHGLQQTVTLAAYDWAMDPLEGLSYQLLNTANDLPAINGMIGAHGMASLAELDNAAIQLINAQADEHKRGLNLRADGYVKAWSTLDLFRELYVQTGNRVGFDHVTGAEIKTTLEKIVYATLGGVEDINFNGGARHALSAERIGQMSFLGQDGKSPAGPGNPAKNVSVGGGKLYQPIVLPLTGPVPAPDLRPGGADAPAITDTRADLASLTGRIVFERGVDVYLDPQHEIYAINANGSSLTRLTSNLTYDASPIWSPDGKHIAYAEDVNGRLDVFVMNADGSSQASLLNGSLIDASIPSWTPDGRKLLFVAGGDGNNDIYSVNADGSGTVKLTHDLHDVGFPRMSPNGKQIVFTLGPGGDARIAVINADGSGQRQLSDITVGYGSPAWSPDGKRIAFDTGRDGNDEIYVINADGSGLTRLTNSPGSDLGPAWSPDGQHIAFASDRDGNFEVYIMSADGSGAVRLTDDPEGAAWPSWTR